MPWAALYRLATNGPLFLLLVFQVCSMCGFCAGVGLEEVKQPVISLTSFCSINSLLPPSPREADPWTGKHRKWFLSKHFSVRFWLQVFFSLSLIYLLVLSVILGCWMFPYLLQALSVFTKLWFNIRYVDYKNLWKMCNRYWLRTLVLLLCLF